MRPRTSDFKEPPEKAIVGTFNNPGVRYYIKRIEGDVVTVVEWLAINADTFLIALTPDTTYTREEWGRLMDRWVLVKPPHATYGVGLTRDTVVRSRHYVAEYTDVTINDFTVALGVALNDTQRQKPLQSPYGIPYASAPRPGEERPVPSEAPQGDARGHEAPGGD